MKTVVNAMIEFSNTNKGKIILLFYKKTLMRKLIREKL